MSAKNRASRTKLTPKQALRFVKRAIKNNQLGQWTQCSLLNDPDAVCYEPILITESSGTDGKERGLIYNIPFGRRGKQRADGVPLVELSIIVDAYNGDFEEVCVFGAPVAYPSPDGARRALAKKLKVPAEAIGAEAVFEPCHISRSRHWHFHKVTHGNQIYYVDHRGRLYKKLRPPKGGS